MILKEGENYMAKGENSIFIKNLPLFIVLLSGAFITILNQTLLGTALPSIMKDYKSMKVLCSGCNQFLC